MNLTAAVTTIIDKLIGVIGLQKQQATQIDNLKKGVLFGGNLIYNSDFAHDYDGWSMHNWGRIAGLTCGFNLIDGTNYYNLTDEKVFWVRDARTSTAAHTQVLAQSNRKRFAVKAGDLLQCSVLIAGVNFQQSAVVYADFYTIDGKFINLGLKRQLANESTPADVAQTLNGCTIGSNTIANTTLDKFHVCFSNCEVPLNAAWCQISIRFRFLPNVEGLGLFARPQVCVISSLDAGYVPYQISTWRYGEKLKTLEADNANNKSTIASLETRLAALESKVANGTIGD